MPGVVGGVRVVAAAVSALATVPALAAEVLRLALAARRLRPLLGAAVVLAAALRAAVLRATPVGSAALPAAVLAGARAAVRLRGRAAAAGRGRVPVRRLAALGGLLSVRVLPRSLVRPRVTALTGVPALGRSLSGSLLCAVVPAAASAPESSHGIERTWSGGVRSSVLWRRARLRLTCDNP
ncbi:hypothetical protein GCM10010349_48870 [Streptomyces flavofungini]|nr:hypothetical protein GCM10010349_48870 [Streptomyces flavofungini]